MPSPSLVHLNLHSEYSLSSATARVEELVRRAVELGQPAIALTDIDVMHGAVEFQAACDRHGIKPIHGLELGIVRRSRGSRETGRLVLLAEADTGLSNLFKLSSSAWLDSRDDRRPAVDEAMLCNHAQGVIALTGASRTALGQALNRGEPDQARRHLGMLVEAFGPDGVKLQVEPAGDARSDRASLGALALAREFGLSAVATVDVRYLTPDDYHAFHTALAASQHATLEQTRELAGPNERWLKSAEEVASALPFWPAALEATVEVADRCRARIELGRRDLASFATPEHGSPITTLRRLAEAGLHERYGDPPPANAHERLANELAAVEQRRVESYFLILWDLVRFARLNEIQVGPGRGAAASSIINYCLQITDIDPLAQGLYFERFFPESWDALPDVDIDFATADRGRVIAYLNRHGDGRVAQVATFGRYHPRAAVRGATATLGLPWETGDRIARCVPEPVFGRWRPIEEYLANEPGLRRLHAEDTDARLILDTAAGIQGLVHCRDTHACALVIADRDLSELAPLQRSPGTPPEAAGALPVVQFPRRSAEQTGLVLLDLLGLNALQLTGETLKRVSAATGRRPDLTSIPLDDPATYAMLERGETEGVFQLDSGGHRAALRLLRADCFEDLATVIAVHRPGAIDELGRLARNKAEPAKVSLPDERMRPILNATYGVVLYQEQIMRMLIEFAGFTAREADAARRALGKKQPERIEGVRSRFFSSSVAYGMDSAIVEAVWRDWIEKPTDYSFNRAHALSYALIAYRLAWLKQKFGGEFLAALEDSEDASVSW